MQVASPAVIPQTLPQLKHLLQISPGQQTNIRKTKDKLFIIGDHGFDLSLLEHDFGYPNQVGIGDLAPGQRPEAIIIPIYELFPEIGNFLFLQVLVLCLRLWGHVRSGTVLSKG